LDGHGQPAPGGVSERAPCRRSALSGPADQDESGPEHRVVVQPLVLAAALRLGPRAEGAQDGAAELVQQAGPRPHPRRPTPAPPPACAGRHPPPIRAGGGGPRGGVRPGPRRCAPRSPSGGGRPAATASTNVVTISAAQWSKTLHSVASTTPAPRIRNAVIRPI